MSLMYCTEYALFKPMLRYVHLLMSKCHSRNVNPEGHITFFLILVDILTLRKVIITTLRLYIPATLIGGTQFYKQFCCSNRSNTTFLNKIFQLITIGYSPCLPLENIRKLENRREVDNVVRYRKPRCHARW